MSRTTTRQRDIGRLYWALTDQHAADFYGDTTYELLAMTARHLIGIRQQPDPNEIRLRVIELTRHVQSSADMPPRTASLMAALIYCASAVRDVLEGDNALADIHITRANHHLTYAIGANRP